MASLNNNLNLLVPIHLDAMVINENDGSQLIKDTSLSLENLTGDMYDIFKGLGGYLEKSSEASAISNDDESILGRGVHLHWVLPEALRRGKHNADGSFELPAAPNRWLIVRLATNMEMQCWVLESDCLNPDNYAVPNWIKEDGSTETLSPVAIGNVQSLKDWQEVNTKAVDLTVMAPGNPEFAASYLSCRNVFGFHDNMLDSPVPDGTVLTYQVYGWYAPYTESLLSGITDKASLNAKLKELSWYLPADNLKDGDIPTGFICHATVHSVQWKKNNKTNLPKAEDIQVGIGNNTSEALAALLTQKVQMTHQSVPRKMLAAFQYKSLTDNGLEGNGLNLLNKKKHVRGFSMVEGGSHFIIEPKDKDNVAKKDGKDMSQLPFDANVSALLVDLNNKQAEYDTKLNRLRSLQAELYALKYKEAFSTTLKSEEFEDKELWNKVQQDVVGKINETKVKIADITRNLYSLSSKMRSDLEPNMLRTSDVPAEITEKLAKLNKLISAKMPDFKVTEIANPSFYEPVDPAVVIVGLKPSEKYFKKGVTGLFAATKEEDDAAKALACRMVPQVSNTINIDSRSVRSYNLYPDVIKAFTTLAAGKLPAEVAELFCEDFLYNPFMAGGIADKMSIPENRVSDVIKNYYANRAKYDRWVSELKTVSAFVPPESAVALWKQPWNPLYLEWKVEWTNTYQKAAALQSTWKFGNKDSAVDFKRHRQLTASASNSEEYTGRTLLSLQMANKIQDMNNKLAPFFGAGLFHDCEPMAQTLSGFTSQLMQRQNGVQLPILAGDNLKLDSDYKIIGNQNTWRPMITSTPFYPIREGEFKLVMLRVVDSYGQAFEDFLKKPGTRRLTKDGQPTFKSSASLSATDKATYSFDLGRRIIQPARLRFDWIRAGKTQLEADAERVTDSDPATSPVCGWLLYHQQDKTISVYDTAGLEICILVKNKNRKIRMDSPPGVTVKPTLASVKNKKLHDTVKFIMADPGSNFDGVKGQIEKVIARTQAKESRQQLTMALPTGFPMAVVTAKFGIELKDLPAAEQSWKGGFAGNKLEPIDYNVTIGDAANKTDGLVGYFVNNDFTKFAVPFAETGAPRKFLKAPATSFKTGEMNRLTLLMDPRTEINISTGLLPKLDRKLDAHIIARGLKGINLRILVAPVITPPKEVSVPLLQTDSMSWDFINPKPNGALLTADQGTGQLNFETVRATEGWLKIYDKTVAEDE